MARLNAGITSEMMPKPRMMMYTSMRPKIQKRCCHSNGSAPLQGRRIAVELAAEQQQQRHGDDRQGEGQQDCVTRSIQVNTGMRNRLMPGPAC